MVDVQATFTDKAEIVKRRASEKYGVPCCSTAVILKSDMYFPERVDLQLSRMPLKFDLSVESDGFEAACRDRQHIANAIGMMSAIGEDGGGEKALYLIQAGDDPIVKVGVSNNPVQRLEALQSAHYRELSLWGVVFTTNRKATFLEQRILEAASGMGLRLLGEWVNMAPSQVFSVLLDQSRQHRIPICNAKIWLDNMISETRRIANSSPLHRRLQRIARSG